MVYAGRIDVDRPVMTGSGKYTASPEVDVRISADHRNPTMLSQTTGPRLGKAGARSDGRDSSVKTRGGDQAATHVCWRIGSVVLTAPEVIVLFPFGGAAIISCAASALIRIVVHTGNSRSRRRTRVTVIVIPDSGFLRWRRQIRFLIGCIIPAVLFIMFPFVGIHRNPLQLHGVVAFPIRIHS